MMKIFGQSENDTSAKQARALVSEMYDILTGFYLNINIGHVNSIETELVNSLTFI